MTSNRNHARRVFSASLLAEKRRARGWRQADFAVDNNLRPKTYESYEQARRRPDLDTLAAIADALGTPLDDFFAHVTAA